MYKLLSYWTIDWLSLGLLAGLVGCYGWLSGWQIRRGATLYALGMLVVALVQVSPLHTLGVHYLLSAHMAEHILLLLVAAPLLVLGLPKQEKKDRVLPSSREGFLESASIFWQRWPWLGWIVGIGLMWFWHIPAVYDATMAHDFGTAYGSIGSIPLCQTAGGSVSGWVNLAHVLHPLSLLLAGVCFAWPVLGPLPAYRLHPLTGVVYLATACATCSLLGMLITFAPVGVYQTYTGADYFGLMHLINSDWGFDRATDQQTAGLLMWVPGCLIYLTGALHLLMTWLTEKETVQPPAPTRRTALKGVRTNY